MKKYLSIALSLLIIFSLTACAGKKAVSEDVMQTIIEQNEYILYMNIFNNEQGDDYVGKKVTKKGIFTTLRDEYSGVTRYYVWGYNDETKCCDWQWEIVPADKENLPNIGSTVEAAGTFAKNESALDKYWIEDCSLTVSHNYTGSKADIDMTTMGGTLERVQIYNLQRFPEKFEGKSVDAYGRIDSPSSIQHPYYNECFTQQFITTNGVQPIGTVVIVSGTYASGVIKDASVKPTSRF